MPTDKAYRYYVDSLMGPRRARPRRTRSGCSGRSRAPASEIDDLMETTSAQLSELSHYAAVILAPPLQHTRLERVDLIPVEGDRALVVLATETGWGMSRILAFEEPVPRSEMREVARILTERYAGLTFQEIRSRVAEAATAPDAERILRAAAYVARKVFQSLWDRNLYVGGAMNMLDQPEFGIGTMRALLKTFEEKRQLIELLTRGRRRPPASRW